MWDGDAVPVPPRVLDLFAVPDDVVPLPGGQGGSVLAGDLVLSPGRDAGVLAWLNPVLARLAVRLDERPGRAARDLRIAMPVPARDGSWAVDGWAASRYEPGTSSCSDLDVLVATGRVLHAELMVAVPARPEGLSARTDRWARAEWSSFDADLDRHPVALVRALAVLRRDVDLGRPQLVHADLAGNVLLDAAGAPVVIDIAPAWRPSLWAEAVCVLDAVLWHGADPSVVSGWSSGVRRQAMLRAALFRLLSDDPPDTAAYRDVLAPLA